MVLSNENDSSALAKPTHFQGGLNMGSRKFGQEARHNRRALGVINKNLVGAQAYPCVVKKRPLTLNHTATECEKKNQPDPVHRPITRKYAAQMASTKAASPQVQVRKADPIVSKTNGFGDCILVDVEEEDNENPVPMALEQTEARPNDEDPMEEVEMEDISVEEQEAVLDIDGSDARNVLAAVDYVTDIYAYYRKVECCSCVSPDYMEQQPDINEKMRAILIDWLIEVHDKFKLLKETLFLTVNLIDRFLSRQTVVRKKLQLVGLVAMLLACKYEEVCVPIVGDLILISDRAYTRDDILQMERLMLNTLQFNMSLPTPYVFMQRFLKAAQSNSKVTHSQELELLSYFLIELSLVEYEMLKYPPSLLAAAAIYTAQCTLDGPSSKQWNKTCEWHSSYSQDSLLECSRLMVGLHKKAATGKLTGVHRKYCTSKFSYTAKLEPALFLLP